MAQAQASRGPVWPLLTPREAFWGSAFPVELSQWSCDSPRRRHVGPPGGLLMLQILGFYPLKIFSHFIEIRLELLHFPKSRRSRPQEYVPEDWSLNVRSLSVRWGPRCGTKQIGGRTPVGQWLWPGNHPPEAEQRARSSSTPPPRSRHEGQRTGGLPQARGWGPFLKREGEGRGCRGRSPVFGAWAWL